MPYVKSGECDLFVDVTGPEDAPALVLCNSLATDLHMWEPQLATWSHQFRLVRYDRRGHGRSSATAGDYDFDMLGRDALAILDSLGFARVHWCGLSTGGLVGQWLATHAPERLDRLVLSNTHYFFADKQGWNTRIAQVADSGLAAICEGTISRWFSAGFASSHHDEIERIRTMLLSTAPEGYMGCAAALRDADFRESNKTIRTRTLIITGTFDLPTPPSAGAELQRQIQGASLVELPAGHLSNIECPAAYADIVSSFLLE